MRYFAEFRFEIRLAGFSAAGASGISGLRHESRNHAMKCQPIIEMFLHEFLDALDVSGRQFRQQFDGNRAGFEFEMNQIGCAAHLLPFGREDCAKRRFSASATDGVVNPLTSPPKDAISLTSRDAMAWCRGSAIRNTVSILGSSR